MDSWVWEEKLFKSKIKFWDLWGFSLRKEAESIIKRNWENVKICYPHLDSQVAIVDGHTFGFTIDMRNTLWWTIKEIKYGNHFEVDIIRSLLNEWAKEKICPKHPLLKNFSIK